MDATAPLVDAVERHGVVAASEDAAAGVGDRNRKSTQVLR
jgi:hypothetical protein